MIWRKPDGSYLSAAVIRTATWFVDERGDEQVSRGRSLVRPNGWTPAWQLFESWPPELQALLDQGTPFPHPPGPYDWPRPAEYVGATGQLPIPGFP